MAAIQLDGLEKDYGDVRALAGVDLEVREGEIFGFLGPNGAGKSTTIDILLDFVRPTAGSARVLDMHAHEQGVEIRQRVGVLPEGYDVYQRLTGRQHVQFVVESKGADADPQAILERVGIEGEDGREAGDRKAGDYSKGMCQRLLLGMALVGDPDLLILDEPSTGLDPGGVRDVREIVRDVADAGTTVFFSSHILSQVEAVCDRVGILRQGELVAVDSIEGLRDAADAEAQLEITVDGDLDRARDVALGVAGVSDVRRDDDGIVVSVSDEAKMDVVTALGEAGIDVRDFETVETSLEELFMSYTEGDR